MDHKENRLTETSHISQFKDYKFGLYSTSNSSLEESVIYQIKRVDQHKKSTVKINRKKVIKINEKFNLLKRNEL